MENADRIAKWVEKLAPKQLAIGEDPIGWQIGDPSEQINHVLVALELTTKVIDYAINIGAKMIVTHHPVFFRPMKSLRTDQPKGRLIQRCIQDGICVYSAHTNLDVARGGLNDWLAESIGLEQVKHFSQTRFDQHLKLVVYVPAEAEELVTSAMFGAGAGWIGEYSHCSFRQSGTGTFQPQVGSNPYIGKVGEVESVNEIRIETIVPSAQKDRVIQAMIAAHPYEEVAYDVFQLEGIGQPQSIGRIGFLPMPITLEQFTQQLKTTFALKGIRFVGDANRLIKKVAIIGGAARSYWPSAQQAGADVFITGDIDYHTAVDALEAGMSLIDPGHHVESIMQQQLTNWLIQCADQQGGDAPNVMISAYPNDNNPFQFV